MWIFCKKGEIIVGWLESIGRLSVKAWEAIVRLYWRVVAPNKAYSRRGAKVVKSKSKVRVGRTRG